MSARVQFTGLEELKAKLRNLPAELTADASRIVEDAANGAARDIASGYPTGETGNLVAGVGVTHTEHGKWAAGAIVKNRAKHAWLFDNGSRQRRTGKGWNRGAMPKANPEVFVPIAIRFRKRMYQQLADLLRRYGLQVDGD